MTINYTELKDLILAPPQPAEKVLRVNEAPGLSYQTISDTNILRRLLRHAFWPASCSDPIRPDIEELSPKREVQRKPGIRSGEFFSYKSKRYIPWESGVERKTYNILENSTDVVWYAAQPLKIPYVKDGTTTFYFPDALICLGQDKYAVVEVKPPDFMVDKSNILKYLALKEHCAFAGWGLLITNGQYTISELARHKLRSDFVAEMRARLKDAPMSSYDYMEVAEYYKTSEMDFAALILQEEIDCTIRPFELAAKSSKRKIWQSTCENR